VLADHHPRRVARALAHNDEHITFGLTLKPPFDVVDLIPGEMEARRKVRSAQRGTKQAPYIRSEAVLPDELQGPLDFNHSFDVAWCGDAVVVFQASIACYPFSRMDMSAIIREATTRPARPGAPILTGALSSIHQQAAPMRIRSMTRIPWGRQNLVPEIRRTVAQTVPGA